MIGERILYGLLVLFVLSILTFLVTDVLPGDPLRRSLGVFLSPERAEQIGAARGLDQPLHLRYVAWLGNLLSGDWGISLVDNRSVVDKVLPRLRRTLILSTLGLLIALPIAASLGVYAAKRSGGPVDAATSSAAISIASLPEFVTGLVLIVVFGVQLGWFPVVSSSVILAGTQQQALGYVLPVMAVAIITTPYLFRLTRATVRDIIDSPYIRGATLRGVHGRRLTMSHVLPNATLQLVGAVFLLLGDLLGGIVVIENVFGFPGLGQLVVDAVLSGDVPTVQVIVLIFGGGYIALNAMADIVVMALNPRTGEQR